MSCSKYDDMVCIIKFINLTFINIMFINLIFMFYVRAEGEATITISTRCCCQIKRGWVKNKISVTLWFYRPPGATNYYLGGGGRTKYPHLLGPHGKRG